MSAIWMFLLFTGAAAAQVTYEDCRKPIRQIGCLTRGAITRSVTPC